MGRKRIRPDILRLFQIATELLRSYSRNIIKVDNWGLKRLAYLVKKREKGPEVNRP